MKNKIGVIHGRFQGLHLGHIEYILAGMERSEHLVIGITNPEPNMLLKENECNPSRTQISSNPFSYYDRYIMIRDSLIENGISQDKFDIVPFPIEMPDKLFNFVPKDAVYYITIYDNWGLHKKALLESLGLKIDVMWVRNNSERLTSGTEVRDLIRNNKKWEHLVPKSVYNYTIKNDLVKKLK